MQAAVASILELPLDEVPHFAEVPGDSFETMVLWASTEGYSLTRNRNKRGLTMMVGLSPRGDWNHAVVARNGLLVHDPYPGGEGLLPSLVSGGVIYPGYADYFHFKKLS